MDVQLPSSGCNILISDSSFYNYSSDSKTRERYYIYDGKAFKAESVYNQYGYTYSGDCLSTGSLVYRPELEVYFPVISFILVCALFLFIYHIFIKRLLP